MGLIALLSRKGDSFSGARRLTASERASMERATHEADAEIAALLRDEPRRFDVGRRTLVPARRVG